MALGCLLFTVLTIVGAHVSFPLASSPVPITLQTLAVILAGAALGPVWGPLSQLLYITLGVSGLPIFANGTSGPGVLLGTTGGYLVGFVIGAWVAGMLVKSGSSWLRLSLGLLAAHLVIFVLGIAQLKLFVGESVGALLALGFFPFVPGMIFKTAVAVGLLKPSRLGWFRS
ncbi:MAG: biotin transporter BioY [Candidatus Eisenbacteria bacterium]|uniref:Biotin transporter n=1 Tax=Eiseniibacteriota bacterium TaxID=2212470 RepID=A0A7Y2H1T1_UNCEI|nr:biotin transporter BioY [Candidatus Eisenbacteria bacterium]